YLLGGGMGWNMPAWGMGASSIVAADVMLASVEIVRASEHDNPDLYWAMRGAGPGFFGIVLRYKLRIHPAPTVIKNSYFITLDNLETAAAELISLLPESDNRSEVLCAFGKFPPPGAEPDWYWAISLMSYGQTRDEAL